MRNAQLAAFAALGSFPYLHQASWLDESIPLLMSAFGPRSLEFAGSVFDGVILHASLPREMAPALEAYAKVRPAARFAGRTGRPA